MNYKIRVYSKDLIPYGKKYFVKNLIWFPLKIWSSAA